MTIDLLESALKLKGNIDRLKAKLDDLRGTGGLTGGGYNEPVTGGMPHDVYMVLIEQQSEIEELEKQFEERRVIIKHELNKIEFPEDVYYKVLKYRYVDCLDCKYIPDLIGYSRRQMFNYLDESKKIALDCTSLHLSTACQ